ncbi:MAG: hypothetical protein AB9882_14480 [Ignavibacteriaceae bacterium]
MVRRLLLRNRKNVSILVFAVFMAVLNLNCDNDPPPYVMPDLTDQDRLIEFVQKEIGPEVKYAYYGVFGSDTTRRIIAAEEISSAKEWGIKFHLYEVSKDTLIKVYETALLEGSLQESKVVKLELPGKKYNLIYYNSGSFFMGSGGGEVYNYVIDFAMRKVNYGHLVLTPKIAAGLFLSPENEKEASAFITSELKRDYPRLKIMAKDYKIE